MVALELIFFNRGIEANARGFYQQIIKNNKILQMKLKIIKNHQKSSHVNRPCETPRSRSLMDGSFEITVLMQFDDFWSFLIPFVFLDNLIAKSPLSKRHHSSNFVSICNGGWYRTYLRYLRNIWICDPIPFH